LEAEMARKLKEMEELMARKIKEANDRVRELE